MTEAAETAAEKVLEVDALSFSYDSQQILKLDRFQLATRESLAVIGPSGCGKTTLLHVLAGLLRPGSGAVRILGEDITQMKPAALDRFRGQNVGMVFQKLFLMPGLNVRQNINLAREMAHKPSDQARTDALLEQLDLTNQANQLPRTLSQGQAQRVAIARALVHNPALVLADEPTSALDDQRADDALSLLKASVESAGASLLVVTHDQRVRGQLDREFEMEPLK